MKRITYILTWLIVVALAVTGCKEDTWQSLFPAGDDIQAGESVLFSTHMSGKALTRASAAETAFTNRMSSYKAVADDYEFTVEMFEQGVTPALGSSVYLPTADADNPTGYAADGTLTVKEDEAPLYWPSTKKAYGFHAVAGNAALATDQTTAEKVFQQDRVEGYGFVPVWNSEATPEAPKYEEEAINYLTPKAWKDANVSLGLSSATDYKKIPLYLRHQRSKITIILKAGEGVRRSDLAFATAASNIHTKINSYAMVEGQKVKTEIQPFAEEHIINYGTAEEPDNVSSTKYTAIVEPWDYLTGATDDVIADIRLSSQHFTFYAGNDSEYGHYNISPVPASGQEGYDTYETARAKMEGYNLLAGRHLTIIATLSRDTRKIVITAYVEDWDETITTSIVDDYGQTGNPKAINSRAALIAFLNSDENRPGNVAIIVPNSIDLEKTDDGTSDPWTGDYIQPLNCTLNMAGATFFTSHQVFSSITESGNLVNGTICVGDDTSAPVAASLAESNYGTVERIDVVPKDANGYHSNGYATRAGLVVENYGTITDCTSELPVQGPADFSGFVGGIAARSTYYSPEDATKTAKMPVIDGCTVNARVDGGESVRGGGIVGEALGRVTNNTFVYGITLLQDHDHFENIVQSKATQAGYGIRAYGNAWPTKAANVLDSDAPNANATPEADRYDAVIDRQAELEALLGSTYNKLEYVYRLSNSFEVTGWHYGTKQDVFNETGGNVLFKLDGNNYTITTDGMLFSNILNDMSNLTVELSRDLIANPDGGSDAVAVLAYSVCGRMSGETITPVKISNIQVKGGNHRIQAATVGGIVVWAFNQAVIENCKCKASLQVWQLGELATGVRSYSGGIVACAIDATITRCQFYSYEVGNLKDSYTLFRNRAETNNAQYVVPEITASTRIYYGGIVGGTTTKSNVSQTPSVLITDCSSWYITKLNNKDLHNGNHQGAIVGFAQYATNNEGSTFASGLREGCEGNWWPTASDGIGTHIDGKSEEQLLGKPNSITPSEDRTYDPVNSVNWISSN